MEDDLYKLVMEVNPEYSSCYKLGSKGLLPDYLNFKSILSMEAYRDGIIQHITSNGMKIPDIYLEELSTEVGLDGFFHGLKLEPPTNPNPRFQVGYRIGFSIRVAIKYGELIPPDEIPVADYFSHKVFLKGLKGGQNPLLSKSITDKLLQDMPQLLIQSPTQQYMVDIDTECGEEQLKSLDDLMTELVKQTQRLEAAFDLGECLRMKKNLIYDL